MKTSALTVMLFLAGSAEAKHHHHHHEQVLAASEEEAQDMETLNAMSTNKLVAGLRSTLDAALAAKELEQLLVRGVANTSDLRRDRLLHLLRQLQLLGGDVAQLLEDSAY